MANVDLTKTYNDKMYTHNREDIFTDKEAARLHASWLTRNKSMVKSTLVEDKGNGMFWVWWSSN